MAEASPLAAELGRLSGSQLQAATYPGNVVLQAGPGSGKTRTLVARAGHLLESEVSPFRGVACITYTNAAAVEISKRLAPLSARSGTRLSSSTVHSFCLNQVLRAFQPLTNEWLPASGDILSDSDVVLALQHCFDQLGIADLEARYRVATLTKIRRSLSVGESTGAYDAREVAAARLYDQRLREWNKIDFEAMVIRALEVVRTHEPVRDLLRARFPHVLVDEYQDLGGVLHQLVLALLDDADISIFAVGDADQSVFGFTGADPKFFLELAARPDFQSLKLDINYRSGQNIIDASQAALGRRGGGVRAAAEASAGLMEIVDVIGDLDEHAKVAVDAVTQRLANGVAPEQIAILYPARGPILDALVTALDLVELPYIAEREEALPKGDVSRFIQRCASRAVAMAQLRTLATRTQVADALRRTRAPTIAELYAEYGRLARDADLSNPSSRLECMGDLQRKLDPEVSNDPTAPAKPWIADLAVALRLDEVGKGHPNRENDSVLTNYEEICDERNFSIQDIASSVEVLGKVLLTTYHSSKGREFDSVILPGLVEGLVPRTEKTPTGWERVTGSNLQEARRGFYVAVSRAQALVLCISGEGYSRYGRWYKTGPSEFLDDMRKLIAR